LINSIGIALRQITLQKKGNPRAALFYALARALTTPLGSAEQIVAYLDDNFSLIRAALPLRARR
ncbi:MAG: hypothetical protein RL336_1738, partial [Pseudomonadota bacterium]